MSETLAQRQLAEVLKASPQVKGDLLRKDFELLLGATGGHRISKYGVTYGLNPLFTVVGETVKVEAVKTYAPLISRGVAGGVSLLALLLLKGKWSRIVAWGGLFENVEAGLDYLESLLLGVL